MVTRREFIKFTGVAGAAALAGLALPGCGESRAASSSSATSASAASSEATSASAASASGQDASASASASAASASASSSAVKSDAIVVYFSRAGENYGVGVIEEGNTAVLAKMVAEKTGADTFEIAPATAYPEGYDACCGVALDEQGAGARPAYVGDVDLSGYKTVYLGYPIWWGDLPMCVYTFLEAHDWAGKEIHPFCTHAGSGLSGTPDRIGQTCAGATVAEALSVEGVTAQNARAEAESRVTAWLG